MSSLFDDVTLTSTTSIPWWQTTPVRQQFNGYNLPLDVTTYGVPLAFTVLVVLILCVVIAYTKAKRRRLRQLHGPRNNLRSISGGVPMNVAAYRNYGMHLAAGDPGPPGQSGYPGELPPPYEIAIQTPPSSASSQTYPSAVSLLPAPPAYTETVQQQGITTNTPTTHGAPPSNTPSSTPHTQEGLTPPPTQPTQPGLQPQDSSRVDSGGQGSGDKDMEDDKKDTEHPPQVDDSGQPRGPKPGTSGDGTTTEVAPGGGSGETSVAPTTTENGSQP